MLAKSEDKASVDQDRRIAIVGMSCLFPQSVDLQAFWQNIVAGRDCLRMVNENEWSTERFFEPYADWRKSERFEKIYCRKGGFISDIAEFNPLKYGVMPKAVAGADVDQMLALKVACMAMADAGYESKPFNADKAEVILGRTSAPAQGSMNAVQYGMTVEQIIDVISEVRPDWDEDSLGRLAEELRRSLTVCSADTVPGIMPNILAGRIAGKLGFRGKSLILDAACASSLIAVEMAVNDLREGRSDIALAGGVFVNSFAVFYQFFCRLGALSHSEQIRPFDQSADGTILGEGIGMVVLKRLGDAIKDGDRIYATIIGVGSSSDGRGTSMLAPAVEGEALALRRAYDDAGISPTTVSLLEAHGTGTSVGDIAEMHAIEKIFLEGSKEGSDRRWCALGSVKSMIGHCQAASGVAGLIKATLSLYERVLPPTLNIEIPNDQIDWKQSPCYLNTKARPWIHAKAHPQLKMFDQTVIDSLPPRRAGVSAFGFGGVNAHAILEEHEDPLELERPSLLSNWETEAFTFAANDLATLVDELNRLQSFLSRDLNHCLKDLAFSVNCLAQATSSHGNTRLSDDECPVRLALVCQSVEDLTKKLTLVEQALSSGKPFYDSISVREARNIYFSADYKLTAGKLAFILPGLGAAYPGMLAELCLHFPEIRMIFDFVDDLASKSTHTERPSQKIFPPPDITGKGSTETSATLAAMDSAVVAVLMAEWALFTLLLNLEIKPDILVGCSTGEFAALTMSGAADIFTASPIFYHLSTSTARAIPQDKLAELKSIRVVAQYELIEPHLRDIVPPVYLSADLSPTQVLLSGNKASIEKLLKRLEQTGIQADVLPAAIPYHTSLVEGVIELDQKELQELEMYAPQIDCWSCSTASAYPSEPDELKKITTELFTKPILFRPSIEALYKQGVRNFVEVGPKGSLTEVVSEILRGKPHLSVASNKSTNSATTQLNHLVAALFTNGIAMDLSYLYARRSVQPIDFTESTEKAIKTGSTILDLRYPAVRLADGWQERTGLSSDFMYVDHGNVGHEVELSPVEAGKGYISAPKDQVISSYLETVSAFHKKLMNAQQEVMASYFHQAGADDDSEQLDNAQRHPLLRKARFEFRDDCLMAGLCLSLSDHPYMLDHSIGGTVRTIAKVAERVYLMPLTVALELMAGVAVRYYPGWKVSSINNVRAFKRIRAGSENSEITIVARPEENEEAKVEVAIYRAFTPAVNDMAQEDRELGELLMQCQVSFVSELSNTPIYFKAPQAQWRSARISPKELYAQGAMFHGPLMQSVLTINRVADRDIVGQVSARLPIDWFAKVVDTPDDSNNVLVNPLLLDNATQLVLFHLFEHHESVDALLPFLVESIHFHVDLNVIVGAVNVSAHLNSLTQRDTNADVQIYDETGRLLVEFRSISSRRIILSPKWRDYITHPESLFLSTEIEQVAQSDSASGVIGRVVEDKLLPNDDGTLAWCADYLLSPGETQVFESLPNARRRREWLLGRIAAKEAVRELFRKSHGIALSNADIEIFNDKDGKPLVSQIQSTAVAVPQLISISHKATSNKDIWAVAIAASANTVAAVGVDLEFLDEKKEGFERFLLSESELTLLQVNLKTNRMDVLTKIWCVKEAVGKALSIGLSGNPKSLEIVAIDPSLSKFTVRPLVVSGSIDRVAKAGSGKLDMNQDLNTVSANCWLLDQAVLSVALISTCSS